MKEPSNKFMARNPRRARLQKQLCMARKRNDTEAIEELKDLIEETPVNRCPKCDESYRKHGRPNGDCIGVADV